MIDAPTKKKLLDVIQPGMDLSEAFLLQIYGYSVTDPYIAGFVLDQLEFAGIKGAREKYKEVVYGWMEEHNRELGRAAAWFRKKIEEEEKEEEKRCRRKIEDMSKAELVEALRKLMNC